MKRKSILTTQYPRLGFHHYTLQEIISKFATQENSGRVTIAPFICRKVSENDPQNHAGDAQKMMLIASRFLPTFEIDQKKFTTNLIYVEKDGDSGVFQPRREKIPDEQADLLGDRTQGGCQIAFGYTPRGQDDHKQIDIKESDGTFSQVVDTILSADTDEISINLFVYVSKQLTAARAPSESDSQYAQRMAERKYLLAKEIVTIYRHYVERVQGMIALKALHVFKNKPDGLSTRRRLFSSLGDLNRVANGRPGPEHDLHSTDEDARRLICSFETIGEIVRSLGIKSKGREDVPTHQDFLDSFMAGSRNMAADKLMEKLENEKRIPSRVGYKKLLEFFIYEALPCEARLCSN